MEPGETTAGPGRMVRGPTSSPRPIACSDPHPFARCAPARSIWFDTPDAGLRPEPTSRPATAAPTRIWANRSCPRAVTIGGPTGRVGPRSTASWGAQQGGDADGGPSILLTPLAGAVVRCRGRFGSDGGVNDAIRLELPEAHSGGVIGPPGPQSRGRAGASADQAAAPGRGVSPPDIRSGLSAGRGASAPANQNERALRGSLLLLGPLPP